MAMHQLKLAHENRMNPLQFKGSKNQKANGISFWASLFSIFILISIFYIFNLSPSAHLHTTKFWFFISNTLILIIAADFGASKKQAEVYDEYVEKGRRNISFPPFESRYPETEIVKLNVTSRNVKNLQETQKEDVKEVVDEVLIRESQSAENEMQIAVVDDARESTEESREKLVEFPPNVDQEEMERLETSIVNYPNERGGGGAGQDGGGGGGGCGGGGGGEDEEEEEDEFSKMSNEELNKRVEEFIQRFNRQIRLQAAQNRIQQTQRENLVY